MASTGPASDAKNAIRSSIKALFPDRECFTLVRPMHDEAALVNLDKIDKSQLRPEFQLGVQQLIRLIISKAHPKRFGTSIITGPIFAGGQQGGLLLGHVLGPARVVDMPVLLQRACHSMQGTALWRSTADGNVQSSTYGTVFVWQHSPACAAPAAALP